MLAQAGGTARQQEARFAAGVADEDQRHRGRTPAVHGHRAPLEDGEMLAGPRPQRVIEAHP